MEEDVVRRAAFHYAAALHDHDAVGHVVHHAEVVGDEEVGVVVLLLEVVEEVEHLGLHADVEGGDALVADDQLGLQDEGAGYAHALALASAELVGVAVVPFGLQAHLLHEFQNAVSPLSVFRFPLAALCLPLSVHPQRFGYGLADGDAGVEG